MLAAAVGTAVGTALGLGTFHSFFYIVVPIMAGGVGEGAIPLSIGYASITQQAQGDLFASGAAAGHAGQPDRDRAGGHAQISSASATRPDRRGPAAARRARRVDLRPGEEAHTGPLDVAVIGAAPVTAVTLYLIGVMAQRLFGWPAPVTMLFLAVILKLARAVSPELRAGAYVVYRFFSTAVTYPLLFAIGVALTPWDKLMAAFTLPNLITIVATVVTLMGTGFVVGRWLGMYPIDTAIVNACHSGQGGTGDVAILTAANRMQLMPFAQIATRIGGAITVTLCLIAMAKLV